MDTQHTTTRSAADGRKINLADAPAGPQGERLLAAGERLGMRIWIEERPVDGPVRTRDHETVGFALKGSATLTLGDRRIDLAPGDSWVVPAGVPHAYRIARSFAAVEATSPPPGAALRDSGATMSSAVAASVGDTTFATRRVEAHGRTRPAVASAAAAAEQYAPAQGAPGRATEADGPRTQSATAERAWLAGDGRGPRADASPDADALARRNVRRHDLARAVHGSAASVFAVLRSGGGPERWLPGVPPGRDYVRFVGEDRRLEWGAGDDSWQAWFDAHTIRGNVVEIQASLTTAYAHGDPREPGASEVMTALREFLDRVADAVDGPGRA